MLTGEAQCKAREHQGTDYPVVAGGRDDDPEEHAEQGHAQRAYYLRRQQVAGNDAKGGPDGPARQGNGHGTVVVEWIQGAFAGNRDAEDFVGDVEADQYAMQQRGVRGKFLADDAAHEHVAGIGYERDERQFEIGRIAGNDGKRRIFAGRCIVEEAGEEALQWIKSGIAGGDAEREGDDEIAQRDRNTIVNTLKEY